LTENRSSSLRTESTALKQQLEEANAKLLDHTVPERAELERVRLEAAHAKEDAEFAKSRLERATTDHEYVREMYQSSSQSAQGLASQITELENSLAVAQNRATGEQAKLREMGYDAFTQQLRAENKKLKAVLKDREAAIKFRDEEIARLKEASRGRMGTRATSVPRSPRLGSPMKMGSRQGSPAAGELRGKLHPLRNG
jgi:predicted nuclease with TOPRIM domain